MTLALQAPLRSLYAVLMAFLIVVLERETANIEATTAAALKSLSVP